MRALLAGARRIAVVGLSPKPHRDSNRVARYLLEHGYEVFPVYPREDQILGRPVFRRVQDIPEGVDLVNVFRRSEELGPVFDDALAAGAPAIWTQYDCVDVESARRAQAAGRPRGDGPLPDGRARSAGRPINVAAAKQTSLRVTFPSGEPAHPAPPHPRQLTGSMAFALALDRLECLHVSCINLRSGPLGEWARKGERT